MGGLVSRTTLLVRPRRVGNRAVDDSIGLESWSYVKNVGRPLQAGSGKVG
jgi:hypothetical protein